MIVIEQIKYFEFRGNVAEIMHYSTPYTLVRVDTDEGDELVEAGALVEKVRGERFRRPSDGTDIVIGCSKQAADLIGIQYEAWANMKSSINELYAANDRLLNYLNKFKFASLWQRLKYLFTGKIT